MLTTMPRPSSPIANPTGAIMPTCSFRDGVLQNAEILANVFANLTVQYSMNAKAKSMTRTTLLAAALTCKAFNDNALNALWSVIPSLIPLLRLIPSFTLLNGVYVLHGQTEDTCWTIYDKYAKRVRGVFIQTHMSASVSRLVYFQLARMRPPTKPIIPNLKTIIVGPGTNPEPMLLLLLPGPHTERFEFHSNSMEDHASDSVASLLATLKRSPYLTRLTLKSPHNVNLSDISCYLRLRSLELDIPSMYHSPLFLASLGDLYDLEDLTLHGGLIEDPESSKTVSPALHIDLSNEDSGNTPFEALRRLKLVGHPSTLARVLDHIQPTNRLQFLVIEEEEDPLNTSETTTSWNHIFSNLSLLRCLKSIEITQCSSRSWGKPGYDLSFEDLLPLLALPNPSGLESFIINQGSIAISPFKHMKSFCSVFCNLKTLRLPFSIYKGVLTPKTLIIIISNCSNLETLKVSLRRKAIEDDLSFIQQHLSSATPIRTGHHLQHLYLNNSLASSLATQPENAMKYAEFFDDLFPHLKTMVMPGGGNGNWGMLEKMTLALQRVGQKRVDADRRANISLDNVAAIE